MSENSPWHILVVEDEPDIREHIGVLLKKLGLNVSAVSSAEEAREALATKKFDLICMDWMLPGMSGVDLTREILEKTKDNPVSILMVTGRTAPEDIVQGLQAGADDYLTKPFEGAVLTARVQSLIRRTEERRKGANAAHPAAAAGGGAAGATVAPQAPEKMKLGEISLRLGGTAVICDDTVIRISPMETKLLTTLLVHKGGMITENQLAYIMQVKGVTIAPEQILKELTNLRAKMGRYGGIIEIVPGVGYRVIA